MKLLFALFLTFASTVHADPLLADKTPRMAAIETKYHMRMAGILRTPEQSDYWTFMITEPATTFRAYPVVVPKDASDHDVDVAIIAASHCAVFYETNLKAAPDATPEPTARPSVSPTTSHTSYKFTVPTRPPREVGR